LVLQVKACGVCGSDLRRWKEGPPAEINNIIPGHEFAGIVTEIGPKQSRFNVWDRVAVAPDIHCGKCYYCQRNMFNLCDNLCLVGITPGYPGGFAEKAVLTNEILSNGIVHKMPPKLSFEEGALAEPCCSVLASHNKTHTTLGDTVVVMGAGPIGCLHIVVAKSRGAEVVVSDPSKIRRKLAEHFKPFAIIDPISENLAEYVNHLTNGVGADVVICANPVATTQTEAIKIVRKGGKVVLFGGLPKANPMTTLDGNKIHYGEIEVIGAFSYHPTIHKLALDLISRQIISAEKMITKSFSLEEIDKAFFAAVEGRDLKVMVTI
jgi:L-iditol 2-dehydrogenase